MHIIQLEIDHRCEFWCITFLWDYKCQSSGGWKRCFCGYYKIGYNSPTKMLCTKIYIYDQFPVEWDTYIPKSMCRSASKLSLKILLCRTVVNYLVKLKLKLGTVRSYPTTFLWPYSFYLWNLAPENAHGAQHFKSCCFLGQPKFVWLQLGYFTCYVKPLIFCMYHQFYFLKRWNAFICTCFLFQDPFNMNHIQPFI